jgi:hypothetical protein
LFGLLLTGGQPHLLLPLIVHHLFHPSLGCGAWCGGEFWLGFRVKKFKGWSVGFSVLGVGLKVKGKAFGVWDLEFRVHGSY